MAQPPRKRQKQQMVLSSSGAEDDTTYDNGRLPQKERNVLTSRPKTHGALRPRQHATQPFIRNSPASSTQKPLKTVKLAKVKSGEQRSSSLYSFFNAKTESQTASQNKELSQVKVQLVKAAVEVDDIIEDECTGDEKSISPQSKHLPPYPAPLRKLSSQSTQTINPQKQPSTAIAPKSVLSQSQRFSRPASRSDVSFQKVSYGNKDERPWAEKYGPSNLEELAVHKKKVADVRGWIQSAFEERHRHVSL